jgi:hypothetical protein
MCDYKGFCPICASALYVIKNNTNTFAGHACDIPIAFCEQCQKYFLFARSNNENREESKKDT